MNVPNEGPCGGKQVHLLWMLMLLKDYLCGRCSVDQKVYRGWVQKFLGHLSDVDLVISIVCWIDDYFGLLIFADIICLGALHRLILIIEM